MSPEISSMTNMHTSDLDVLVDQIQKAAYQVKSKPTTAEQTQIYVDSKASIICNLTNREVEDKITRELSSEDTQAADLDNKQ